MNFLIFIETISTFEKDRNLFFFQNISNFLELFILKSCLRQFIADKAFWVARTPLLLYIIRLPYYNKTSGVKLIGF